MEMTYIALRPLRVGGQMRQEGDLVPEAKNFHNLGAYLGNYLSAVPRDSVDQQALEEAEARAFPEPEPEPVAEQQPEDEAEEQSEHTDDLADLNAREIVAGLRSGTLDPDEVLEAEMNRPDGARTSVLRALDEVEDEAPAEEG